MAKKDDFYQLLDVAGDVDTPIDGEDFRLIFKRILLMFSEVFGTEMGNSIMEVMLSRGGYKDLKARLDAGDAELFATMKDVAQKITKGTGAIEWGDFSQSVRENMTAGQVAVVGKNSVGSKNVINGQISQEKTNFLKIGKNMFNYKTASANRYIDHLSGAVSTAEGFFASDFIYVQPNSTYKQIIGARPMAFYDASYNFITGSNSNNATFTTPVNASYIRVTIRDRPIDQYMVVKASDSVDVYEKYYLDLVDKKKISSDDINPGAINKEHLAKGSVTNKAFGDLEGIGNLLYTSEIIQGKYAYSSLENIFSTTNSANFAYSLIRVKPNTRYSFTNGRFVVEVKSDGLAVTQFLENVTTITTTDQAVLLAVSFNKNSFPIDEFMIFEGDLPTEYSAELFYKIPWLYTGGATTENITINLPNTLYATVGTEFNIFTKNVLKYDASDYNVKYSASVGKSMKDRFTVTPISAGNFDLTLDIYKKSEWVASETVSVVVSNPRTTPIKVMAFGDSTIRAGHITQRLVDKMGDKIQLVGVMGSSPNLFEGRGGWTAGTYRSDKEYLDFSPGNPFYNPATSDFDFGYYMTTQGVTGLKVVIITLGINDVFSFESDSSLATGIDNAISNFDFIIGSIKAYDPNIKVAINLTIPPNDDQDKFGEAYGNGQTQWRYKYNNHRWVNKLITYYKNKHDLINIHTSLDTAMNISDGVHPNLDGYNQIGDTDYSYLNSL